MVHQQKKTPTQSVPMFDPLLKHVYFLVKRLAIKAQNSVNLKSLLTLETGHLHCVLRLKTETPTVLDCSKDFKKGVSETMEKQAIHGFHY